MRACQIIHFDTPSCWRTRFFLLDPPLAGVLSLVRGLSFGGDERIMEEKSISFFSIGFFFLIFYLNLHFKEQKCTPLRGWQYVM